MANEFRFETRKAEGYRVFFIESATVRLSWQGNVLIELERFLPKEPGVVVQKYDSQGRPLPLEGQNGQEEGVRELVREVLGVVQMRPDQAFQLFAAGIRAIDHLGRSGVLEESSSNEDKERKKQGTKQRKKEKKNA